MAEAFSRFQSSGFVSLTDCLDSVSAVLNLLIFNSLALAVDGIKPIQTNQDGRIFPEEIFAVLVSDKNLLYRVL